MKVTPSGKAPACYMPNCVLEINRTYNISSRISKPRVGESGIGYGDKKMELKIILEVNLQNSIGCWSCRKKNCRG